MIFDGPGHNGLMLVSRRPGALHRIVDFSLKFALVVCLQSLAVVSCTEHSPAPVLAPATVEKHIPSDTELDPHARPLAHSIRKFNLQNPVSDLEKALARNDHRFLGVNGYACAAPGLDYSASSTDEQHYVSSFGIICIEGTAELGDQQFFDLQRIADAYAATYNRELLRRIRSGLIE
jgi:hypothetical protein